MELYWRYALWRCGFLSGRYLRDRMSNLTFEHRSCQGKIRRTGIPRVTDYKASGGVFFLLMNETVILCANYHDMEYDYYSQINYEINYDLFSAQLLRKSLEVFVS
jgi:hypothetical protein